MTKLQEYRLKAKLTQAQVSELSGVNLRTIQALESGKRDINLTAAKTVYKLSVALKLPQMDALIDTDE